MNFADRMTEDRRLVLLRLLDKAPGSQANTYVLTSGLRDMGHKCTRDRVETDTAWLAEQGLVSTADADGVTVVKLRRRGREVAMGDAIVPGVKSPELED